MTAVRLADLTTLRLGGPAADLIAPESEQHLVETVLDLDRRRAPLLVLGGGSNLVVADEGFAGTVVEVVTRGRELREEPTGAGSVLLSVSAGEPWDDLVMFTVAEGLAGLEGLSGIPGLAGATPVQNVGAYGQEVAQTISGVRVLDRSAGAVRELSPAECGFGYRTSALRGHDRYLVLSLTFRLRTGGRSLPIRYADLARALEIEPDGTAPVEDVRTAVLALRRSKGMVLDPADPDTVSAGSFFTNPVLDAMAADRLPAEAPRYPAEGGRTKTSAAWLIEAAGFRRGYQRGRVRLSSKHSLALTNAGDATTAELLALAREIRDSVESRFGVRLSPEPVLVGCSL